MFLGNRFRFRIKGRLRSRLFELLTEGLVPSEVLEAELAARRIREAVGTLSVLIFVNRGPPNTDKRLLRPLPSAPNSTSLSVSEEFVAASELCASYSSSSSTKESIGMICFRCCKDRWLIRPLLRRVCRIVDFFANCTMPVSELNWKKRSPVFKAFILPSNLSRKRRTMIVSNGSRPRRARIQAS